MEDENTNAEKPEEAPEEKETELEARAEGLEDKQ